MCELAWAYCFFCFLHNQVFFLLYSRNHSIWMRWPPGYLFELYVQYFVYNNIFCIASTCLPWKKGLNYLEFWNKGIRFGWFWLYIASKQSFNWRGSFWDWGVVSLNTNPEFVCCLLFVRCKELRFQISRILERNPEKFKRQNVMKTSKHQKAMCWDFFTQQVTMQWSSENRTKGQLMKFYVGHTTTVASVWVRSLPLKKVPSGIEQMVFNERRDFCFTNTHGCHPPAGHQPIKDQTQTPPGMCHPPLMCHLPPWNVPPPTA